MLDDQLLYPPGTYASTWTVVGVALLVLVVVVLLAVSLVGRDGRLSLPRPARRSTRVRRAAIRRIDEIEAAHLAGRLDAPAASSELSQAVRRFAAEWSGVLYPAMTLAEIEAVGADEALRSTVARLYTGSFGSTGEQVAVADDARLAREVVRGWNRS